MWPHTEKRPSPKEGRSTSLVGGPELPRQAEKERGTPTEKRRGRKGSFPLGQKILQKEGVCSNTFCIPKKGREKKNKEVLP